jgi:hypothetical protein
MDELTPHCGIYLWTDWADGSSRPMVGSAQAKQRHKDWLRSRAENLATPEGEAWLARHNFTKTKSEDLDWLITNGKV